MMLNNQLWIILSDGDNVGPATPPIAAGTVDCSMGAVAKGGHSPLIDIYSYAERVIGHGRVFIDAPGRDPVPATGKAAGDASMMAPTTRRESCFGLRRAPSYRLFSNPAHYQAMEKDVAIDCGTIATTETTIAARGREIFELIIQGASGRKTKSRAFGCGDNAFVAWHLGATL